MGEHRLWKYLAAIVLIAFASQAQAKRTLIDTTPGSPYPVQTLGGYCDFNGDDCGATPLGYTVDFGGGSIFSSVIIYGNGLISFGDTPVSFGTKEQLAASGGDIGYFGGAVMTPGLDNYIVSDINGTNEDVFNQSAYFYNSASGLTAGWETCDFPSQSCYNGYGATIQPDPGAGGLRVSYYYLGENPPLNLGLSIPGVDAESLNMGGTFFIIPATFGPAPVAGVPEPATWAMLMLGLAGIGAALRQRRREMGLVHAII